ncbi:hypothetical protein PV405_08870 [Streptomyces sp. ME02-6979-3A]|uniref:hypothetical protein n=1 Tax=Streptomyces sp. ME02-6979-3A TaxID=3028673 RepID=UPI0029AA4985|nr:hypothetical protein [Streptomyces sp. ME02-6979-3A]MDX3324779.1 hypothetical protein [Streptomyces sp. ME02-6979-3A]
MTDTPMTPDRERMIRIWHEELARLTDRTAVMRREALGDLLAEIDRLRAQVAELEAAVERTHGLASRLEEFAENALRVDDRELYTAIATDLRSRLAGQDAGTPRPTGLPSGLTGGARHDARAAAEAAPRDLRPGAEAARRMLRPGACDACGDIPDEWCPTCAACRTGCYSGHNNNPCTHPNAPWNKAATP